jgi:hypothetical protein
MIIVDELVKSINICLHPSKNTKEKQSLGQAIGFYYKFALIPIIISLIVQIVFPLPAIFSFSTSISLVGSYIIGFPFEILVVAGFIYLFGSVLFHKFKGNFEATFVSVLYGYIPMILLYWLILLIASSFAFGLNGSLAAGSIFILITTVGQAILLLWGLLILVFALSNQNTVTVLDAFLYGVLPLIILLIIFVLALLSLVGYAVGLL